MSVGQLARRAGLTAKALRHYDRVGVFAPASVDTAGYRWYTPDQLAAARLIARLRGLDVPLDDVRRCLADPAVVADVLQAHERRLEARITRLRGDLHELHHLLTDSGASTMTDEPEILDHRRLGAALFNGVWELLEQEDRSVADDDRMLHMAHASRHHWGEVGGAAHLARGEWQCSRVYSVLRRAEPALHHARRALALCTENGLGDWDLAFCHEALARAHAIAGESEAAREEAERALAVDIAEDEDRALVLADLETIPGLPRFW
ncbi:MAG: MerR family transcriptional regulator, thiopeptide resistance regulator [Pseudonocardiales bacterium]|jgi:DNA-binding transcriptional MerR regulator|nr:MerR family transcriptional regulator, thiopeptide resistance regulator [Pseudonocardiales bacterium]